MGTGCGDFGPTSALVFCSGPALPRGGLRFSFFDFHRLDTRKAGGSTASPGFAAFAVGSALARRELKIDIKAHFPLRF